MVRRMKCKPQSPGAITLRAEIDAITADRQAAERERPGYFWGTCGRTLSRAEAEVFAIAYEDFPRMITVWEAWLDVTGSTMDGPIFHSVEAIAQARALRSGVTDMDEVGAFTAFATEVGGLSMRQAEAIYWKDRFWRVREGHETYPDEASPDIAPRVLAP